MFQLIWYFALVLFVNCVVMWFQFWQVKNAQTLTLLGMQFTSIWTFWTAYTTLISVIYWPVNYLFFYLFWHGRESVFPGKIWHVQETFWFAQLLCTVFLGWFFFSELPAKNAVAALFFLACAFLAIIWK